MSPTSRDETIIEIRSALKRRSGRTWSVKGGRGTAYGWITIASLPRERGGPWGDMSLGDRQLLAKLLGFERPVHQQGLQIPAAGDYYEEYMRRANGQTPTVRGFPYWD